MPSSSRQQQKFIFAKRGQYNTKADTPEKFKWVWDKDWETVEEKVISERYKPFNFSEE